MELGTAHRSAGRLPAHQVEGFHELLPTLSLTPLAYPLASDHIPGFHVTRKLQQAA